MIELPHLFACNSVTTRPLTVIYSLEFLLFIISIIIRLFL